MLELPAHVLPDFPRFLSPAGTRRHYSTRRVLGTVHTDEHAYKANTLEPNRALRRRRRRRVTSTMLTLLSVSLLAFGAATHASSSPWASTHTAPFPDFGGSPVLGRTFDAARQAPITSPGAGAMGASYDDGMFTPVVESLRDLRADRYTTLSHPAYPKHAVRVKQSTFCDEKVK